MVRSIFLGLREYQHTMVQKNLELGWRPITIPHCTLICLLSTALNALLRIFAYSQAHWLAPKIVRTKWITGLSIRLLRIIVKHPQVCAICPIFLVITKHTGCFPQTATKENDIAQLLKMIKQIWKKPYNAETLRFFVILVPWFPSN